MEYTSDKVDDVRLLNYVVFQLRVLPSSAATRYFIVLQLYG